MHIEDIFLKKRLLIISGKGGIGKSLVSAALGQYAAESKKKVLLVEHSREEQLAPLFGHSPVGQKETEVSPNLYCVNLSYSQCLEEYVSVRLGKRKLFETIFNNNIIKTFLDTIPGLGETMLLGRLFYTSELDTETKYDLIIFDAPASGHYLSLLTTPDAVISTGIGGPMVKEVTRVKEFLQDETKTGTILVTVPEELIVSESLEFIPQIQEQSPNKLLGLIINRSTSEHDISHLDHFLSTPQEDKVKPAIEFIRSKLVKAKKSQAKLMAGIEKINFDLPILMLPELGIIKEPLPIGFGKKLFENSHDTA